MKLTVAFHIFPNAPKKDSEFPNIHEHYRSLLFAQSSYDFSSHMFSMQTAELQISKYPYVSVFSLKPSVLPYLCDNINSLH
jgi:hypothetical protein